MRAYAGEYVAVHQALSNKPGSFHRGFPKMSELDPAKFLEARARLTPEQIHLQGLGFQVKAGVKVTAKTLVTSYKAAQKFRSQRKFVVGMGDYLRDQGYLPKLRRQMRAFPKLKRSASYMKAIEESTEAPSPPPRARRKKRRPVTTSSEEDEPIVPLRKRKTERTLRGRVKPKFDAETLEPVAEIDLFGDLAEMKHDPGYSNINPLTFAKGAKGTYIDHATELHKSTQGFQRGVKPSNPRFNKWNLGAHSRTANT